MFVYDIVTCWDKKVCFKNQKYLFFGLAMVALAEYFFGFLDNVLRVLGKNITLAPRFGPISVHFFSHNPSLCMINQ
jgi:hypothetical protein